MKKYNLLKVLAITVLVAWVLTLFIPGSYVGYTGIEKSSIASNGIFGLFSNLSISISYFNGIAVLLIAIACFYGVLNKVSAYERFTNKVTSLFKGRKRFLFILVTIVFALISAFVSDFIILLVFVPFIWKVMKNLEIDDKAILSSTIVSSIIGYMCNIYNRTLFSTFSININTLLLFKSIVLLLSLCLLIFFTAPKRNISKSDAKKTSKKTISKKVVNTKEEGKKVNKVVYLILTILLGSIGINKFYAGKIKKGILSLVFCWTFIPAILSIAEFITVLTMKSDKDKKINVDSLRIDNVLFGTKLVLFTLFIIGSIIPWESLFTNFEWFTGLGNSLSNIKIGNYNVFNNIIGTPVSVDATTGSSTGALNIFGSWTLTDVSILLFILTIVMVIANKVDNAIATVTASIKKVLPVAITAMLISIVLVTFVTSGVGVTISNAIISLTDKFNVGTSVLTSMVGSIFIGDFYYYLVTVGQTAATVVASDYYSPLAFIIQNIYGVMMIIAPTSVALVIGLYYLNIPYNKWIKYILKPLIGIFAVVVICSIVIYGLA